MSVSHHPRSALDKNASYVLRTQIFRPQVLAGSLWGILIDQEPSIAAKGGGQDTEIFARLSQLSIAKY